MANLPTVKLRPGAGTLPRSRATNCIAFIALSPFGIITWLLVQSPMMRTLIVVGAVLLSVIDLLDLLVLQPARLRRTTIRVDTDGIRLTRGFMVRRTDFVPISRITVVRKEVGPIAKRFNLVDITIVSTTRDVSVPALTLRDAATFLVALNRAMVSERNDATQQ